MKLNIVGSEGGLMQRNFVLDSIRFCPVQSQFAWKLLRLIF
jgi:hypothetical protein